MALLLCLHGPMEHDHHSGSKKQLQVYSPCTRELSIAPLNARLCLSGIIEPSIYFLTTLHDLHVNLPLYFFHRARYTAHLKVCRASKAFSV